MKLETILERVRNTVLPPIALAIASVAPAASSPTPNGQASYIIHVDNVIHVDNGNLASAIGSATGLKGLALKLAEREIRIDKGFEKEVPAGDYEVFLDIDSINSQSEYSSIPKERLDAIRFKDNSTKTIFLASMERMRKYGLEPVIQKYCKRFGIKKEYVIPLLIQESNMNVRAHTTRGGCTGIGQVTKAAVKSVNNAYGTNFRHTNNPRYVDEQIGAAAGYFSLKVNQRKGYIDNDTAAKLGYFAYNAGRAPVDLAIRDLQKSGLEVSWKNVGALINPSLLRRSSAFYRRWSPSALKNKAEIIKKYVRNAETYRGYLEQLEF